MKLNVQSAIKSLNKAYFKEKVSRSNIEKFKENLTILFNKAQVGDSENTLKDYITDFFKNTWYSPDHAITVNKERKDFTIHTATTAKDPVAVIAEVKKISSSEMMTPERPNVKALHELVLYYLQERTSNNEIKYLIATDINNWILIDANEFEKKIHRNTKIKKLYEVYVNDKKDNPFFYNELKKVLAEMDDTITATYFNLYEYKKIITNSERADDKKLITLYKILSPVHLIKLSFINDSNSLDKNFYSELLDIIGLEEVKEGGKKLIQRKKEKNEASLIENTIIKLQDKDCIRDLPDGTKYGLTRNEQEYNIALELCITWINRILFLKLLEAQLLVYHRGDKSYMFLNTILIHDFDELNNLFLQVLAEKPETRRERLQNKFSKVPYLNSSLFERTELERKTIDISSLDNSLPFPLLNNTVLKDEKGERRRGSLPMLNYLFNFLDSYDFTSEGTAEIQEENKTLINASVLGLIFEKINGYKDGSFFTPGFITMYMCREALRHTVVQKFNETNGWNCKTFEDLQGQIEYQDKGKRQLANNIINSITICDPAVGSGHFLVSSLNELISIKHDLKILQFRYTNQRVKEYSIETVNDELIIQNVDTEDLFEYTLNQKGNIKPELQQLQETLFHEKETLIENCLFGVDINANSVKICRLRLWIELLKNTYYTKESGYTQLETLPNIDINIKQGNSLVSRYSLDSNLTDTLQKSKWTIDSYRIAVQTYRNAQSKEEKHQMEELIESIQKDFSSDVSTYDPINKKLSKLRGELYNVSQAEGFFGENEKRKTFRKKEIERLSKVIDQLEIEKDEIQNNVIYKEAFEWRFEFPEILDNEGKFLGFDVIIGNPPYVQLQKESGKLANIFIKLGYDTFERMGDIYCLFYEKGVKLLKENGVLCFITSNKWMRANYGVSTRQFLAEKTYPLLLIDFGNVQVFETATVDTNILLLQSKEKSRIYEPKSLFGTRLENDFSIKNQTLHEYVSSNGYYMPNVNHNAWIVGERDIYNIKEYVEGQGKPLTEWDIVINYGLKTGLNEAFIVTKEVKERLISEDANSKQVLKVLLRGKDLYAWHPEFNNLWLIYIPWHFPLNEDISINGPSAKAELIFRRDYPAIYNHLSKFRNELSKRNKTEVGIRYEWFALQRFGANYWRDFEKPKIIYPEITKYMPFIYDEFDHYYTNNKCFILTGERLKYLVCFFNSKLFKYCFSNNFPELQGGSRELRKIFFEKIPVKPVTDKQEIPFIKIVDYLVALRKEKLMEHADQLMLNYFEQIANALIFEYYFESEFENRQLHIAKHIYELPELNSDDKPLHQLRKIYVSINQDHHSLKQSLFSMLAIPQIGLVINSVQI